MKKELGIFVLLVVLCVVTGFMNHAFFSEANLTNTANLIGLRGIFSIGVGLIIITGGIDLSIGSMIALVGMLLVMALTEWSWPVESWVVSPNEIKDVRVFSDKLQQPSDGVSKFLWVQFSGSFKDELAKFDETKGKPDSLKSDLAKKLDEDLAKELNKVIHGASIYETNRFAGVSLSAQAQSLIEKDSQNTSHDKLNRLLLQDKYPNVLAKVYQHWPWPVAVALALFVAMILGLAHGLLITRFKMQPFIVTLCGLLLYRGIARYIAHDTTKGFGDAEGFKTLQSLASGKFHGFPMPFLLLVVIAVILWVVLHRSVYGRYLFAVGRNEQATLFSGVNSRRVIGFAYVLGALLTGISAILFAFYTNSVSPSSQGNFYELYGIAAAVLGGCSLRGGEGSILGIVIGTTLLLVLENLVNLLGIDSSLNFAVMGAVVLFGVLADQIFKNRSAKKSARPA